MINARVATWLLVGLVGGCGKGSDASRGTERQPCYGNGTCNDGLVCLSDLCVRPSSFDGGTGTGSRDAGSSPAAQEAGAALGSPDVGSVLQPPDASGSPVTPDTASLPVTPDAAGSPVTPDTASPPAAPDAAELPGTPDAAVQPESPDVATLADALDAVTSLCGILTGSIACPAFNLSTLPEGASACTTADIAQHIADCWIAGTSTPETCARWMSDGARGGTPCGMCLTRWTGIDGQPLLTGCTYRMFGDGDSTRRAQCASASACVEGCYARACSMDVCDDQTKDSNGNSELDRCYDLVLQPSGVCATVQSGGISALDTETACRTPQFTTASENCRLSISKGIPITTQVEYFYRGACRDNANWSTVAMTCQECTTSRCAAQSTACASDPACMAKTFCTTQECRDAAGPSSAWTELQTCLQTNCTQCS